MATEALCDDFSDATDIFLWAEAIRTSVGFDAASLQPCGPTICRAVWGTGNPDISGIGVVVAYVLEAAGGFLLAVVLWSFERFPHRLRGLREQFYEPVRRGMATFFSSAVFFCLAIEIASTVVLARKDFLAGTDGFGLHEAQLTWAISVACLLPLLYPVAMVGSWTRKPLATADGTAGASKSSFAAEARSRERAGRNYATAFFYLALATFSYPLLSQCVNNWRPSTIGEGRAPDGKPSITQEEIAVVNDLCFPGGQRLSASEYKLLCSFELAASVVVLLFAASRLVGSTLYPGSTEGAQNRRGNGVTRFLRRAWSWAEKRRGRLHSRLTSSPVLGNLAQLVAIILPMICAGPLLWGIFRIRGAQRALAEASENIYADDDWTFGQVAALVMFAPVIADMVYVWWYPGLAVDRD